MSMLEVTSPYDGSVIGTVERAGESSVEEALATAYDLYRDRHHWPRIHERVDILERTARLMVEQTRVDTALEILRVARTESASDRFEEGAEHSKSDTTKPWSPDVNPWSPLQFSLRWILFAIGAFAMVRSQLTAAPAAPAAGSH